MCFSVTTNAKKTVLKVYSILVPKQNTSINGIPVVKSPPPSPHNRITTRWQQGQVQWVLLLHLAHSQRLRSVFAANCNSIPRGGDAADLGLDRQIDGRVLVPRLQLGIRQGSLQARGGRMEERREEKVVVLLRER